MRAIAMFALLGLIAARPAAAEPQAASGEKTKKKPAAAKQPAKQPAEQPAAVEGTKQAPAGLDLRSMAAAAAKAAGPQTSEEDERGKAESRRLDLTPQRQFQSGKLSSDRRGAEARSGIGLGDDTDWRVQAVQVGAIAATFGALVALCGSGNCLLPEIFGGGRDELGPSPDLQIREEPQLRDPR